MEILNLCRLTALRLWAVFFTVLRVARVTERIHANRITKRFPSVSTADSLDWKKPDPDAITKKVVNSVKSGSIVLFHNDLENTTEALPQILEQLSAKGYEFIPVSELIYTENYSIDSNGMQIPAVQSNTEITPENVEEVMAEYSDELHSAGFTDEQMALAAQAVKNGAEIPAEVYEALAQMTMADSAPDTAQTAETSAPESAPNGNAAAK